MKPASSAASSVLLDSVGPCHRAEKTTKCMFDRKQLKRGSLRSRFLETLPKLLGTRRVTEDLHAPAAPQQKLEVSIVWDGGRNHIVVSPEVFFRDSGSILLSVHEISLPPPGSIVSSTDDELVLALYYYMPVEFSKFHDQETAQHAHDRILAQV